MISKISEDNQHKIMQEAIVEFDGMRNVSERDNDIISIWTTPNKLNMWNSAKKNTLVEALRIAREGKNISCHHSVTSKQFGFSIDEYLMILKQHDFDLFQSDEKFCEWPHTSSEISATIQNRLLSTDFLYRMIIALRLKKYFSSEGSRILEIGGGSGDLARCIKLINPSVKYRILDLPGTLFLSYIFLRANFPDATFKLVKSAEDFISIDELNEIDFVFIPNTLQKAIPADWKIDLVVNCNSLGEMPQRSVLDYMELIQTRLDVDYFYSLNRYFQDNRDIDTNLSEIYQADCSLVLDPYWDVKEWTYCPDFVKSMRFELDTKTSLEVLMKRRNPSECNLDELLKQSNMYLQEANSIQEIKSYKWHELMWKSILLNPCLENVQPYYDVLIGSQTRERWHYHNVLKELGLDIPSLPGRETTVTFKIRLYRILQKIIHFRKLNLPPHIKYKG
jgi:putative sugar O-methyltransferase